MTENLQVVFSIEIPYKRRSFGYLDSTELFSNKIKKSLPRKKFVWQNYERALGISDLL